MAYEILNTLERAQLPLVLTRRTRARQIIQASIKRYRDTFSNCIMVQGKAGTGKTTLVEELLLQMREECDIADYKRVPGHVTPRSLYHCLRKVHEPQMTRDGYKAPVVVVFDDVDCLGDEGCLELMKAAFDTRSDSPTNRKVFYMTEDGGTGFKYDGFGIIICNNNFGKKVSVHQEALLDRVQQMSIDLEPNDMNIYNLSLVEDMLNSGELTDSEADGIYELCKTYVRKWISMDAFRKAGIPFSLRLIKKFVDSQRLFSDEWQYFSTPFKRLEAACIMADPEPLADAPVTNVRIIKNNQAEPAKNAEGKYIDPKTGAPYSSSMQCYYRQKFAKTA